jgi:hypothetical protein
LNVVLSLASALASGARLAKPTAAIIATTSKLFIDSPLSVTVLAKFRFEKTVPKVLREAELQRPLVATCFVTPYLVVNTRGYL